MEKMGTLKKNGDQMGTKKLILVPMGTKVPKWGPTWEQCASLIVFLLLSSLLILFCEVKKMQEQVKNCEINCAGQVNSFIQLLPLPARIP